MLSRAWSPRKKLKNFINKNNENSTKLPTRGTVNLGELLVAGKDGVPGHRAVVGGAELVEGNGQPGDEEGALLRAGLHLDVHRGVWKT